MAPTLRSVPRWKTFALFAFLALSLLYLVGPPSQFSFADLGLSHESPPEPEPTRPAVPLDQVILRPDLEDGKFHWANVPQQFPVASMRSLPARNSTGIPKIQYKFGRETDKERKVRLARQHAVRGNFTHAWKGYKRNAWLKDEVGPLTGEAINPFGGWAATLVDSLDTLWIMGLYSEFEAAVEAVNKIDFSTSALVNVNVFETNIRFLGGFLGAYDISGGKYPQLLVKATELGDMLYKAFDTPNRMPIVRWNFKAAVDGASQVADENVLVSEIGSLSLEFTRLSQITGDPRYFDAVQRVMDVFDDQQNKTKLPGLWPVVVNARSMDFTAYESFTIGGMADSLYEYLPKQHILLGAGTAQYKRLYLNALVAMRRNIFYRPMTPNGENIRLAGQVQSNGKRPLKELKTDAEAQHLGCFAGGMVAIAAKIFPNKADLGLAKKLVWGCLWAYEVMPLGIMPEIMHTVPCDSIDRCKWDEKKWFAEIMEHNGGDEAVASKIQKFSLRSGVAKIDDPRYILRPEAIESVFILYRITADRHLLERAWQMFEAIVENTITDIAHAGLDDCTIPNPPKSDRMESFWLAETLKYFFLIFSEPNVVSLDDYVFNTEAHPLKRPS